LLGQLEYSLQSNRKTEEGNDHPDRDAQFRHINEQVRRALAAGRPVISVDTKKKELVGNYGNTGRQWRKTRSPQKVNGHDFPAPSVLRAYPYGIYDVGRNTGFVNIGTDHDTGAFAVASIRGWWRAEGRRLYPHTRQLLITADGGGSNGYRLRQWKVELQKLAEPLRLPEMNWARQRMRDIGSMLAGRPSDEQRRFVHEVFERLVVHEGVLWSLTPKAAFVPLFVVDRRARFGQRGPDYPRVCVSVPPRGVRPPHTQTIPELALAA
jgi:hypothetical protein